jgi:hypothetical protein
MTLQLSRDFSLDEFTRSQIAVRHGIPVVVEYGSEIHSNLVRLCVAVLQPLRDALGPVHVTSGYRPSIVNTLIGGAPTSQHLYGLAADIVVPGFTPREVARWIRDNLDSYDQLIHEFGEWTHVSVAPSGQAPRNERLTAVKVPRRIGPPRTVYVPGLMTVDEALKSKMVHA